MSNMEAPRPAPLHHRTRSVQMPLGLYRGPDETWVSGQLNFTQVRSIKMPFPPTINERTNIAEELSDADALIESLEQLIAKKRHIKQGAMQELLSCNCRLPGFNEPWIEVPLGKLGAWIGGGTPSMKDARYWTDGTIPWATSADIRIGTISSSLRKITESAIAETSATLAPKGAIVVVTRSGILRRFFPFCALQKAVAINQDIKALIPNDLALCEFIGQAFEYKNEAILSACMKTGTTVESIEMTWLKKFMINVPSSRTEQQAIASLLSDLDSEIFTLEAKLNKARQIKQGMMQELLTGRIRLI
ncbi:MAG: restriction endonuclease subunit S [Alphaproteobacteria bacterium]|nr:restriction endonuclease subunit S [Alphaproteobacteria bacterium]